ncbi:MAG: hypothetical protein K5899_10785 [Bacteroidaceae bacterium]|nr:hypothetical protein [Bacteroidaceae bacterium]
MKQFAFIFIATLLVVSCGPSAIENKIIGKWAYSSSYSDNIKSDSTHQLPTAYMTWLLESVDVFNEDHTEYESGEFEIYYELTLGEYGFTNTIILEYKTDYQGTWKVKDDNLILTGESCTYEFVKGYAMRPMPNFDADYYVNIMKEYSDTAVIQPLIKSQLSQKETQIHELTNDEMVLKNNNTSYMMALSRIKKSL